MENVPIQQPQAKTTVLFSEGRWQVVNLANLVFVESRQHNKLFYFADRAKPYVVATTMPLVVQTLSALTDFVFVHRSFIINMKYVVGYDSRSIYVLHQSREYAIPVSNSDHQSHFVELFG